MSSKKTQQRLPNSSASNNSITDSDKNVNKNYKNSSDRYALPDGVEVDDGKMSYKSIFGNMEKVDFDKEYYKDKADYWKSEYDKINGRDRLLGLLMSKAQKMKDLKLGTFANSTQFDSELFRNSIEKLARIQFRGNLNISGTRKIMGELLQWYRKDNPVLEYVDDSNTGLYVQSVADMLESLSEGDEGCLFSFCWHKSAILQI